MRITKIIGIVLLFTGFSYAAFGQQKAIMERIRSPLQEYNEVYFQQKVYIHTDRQVYAPGDEIWMKGYVLDAATHQFDNRSTNLYVDLVNFKGQIIHNRVLRLEQGTAKGEISISDTLQNGEYRLRAYTGWMHNYSPDFWFSRPIEINNEERVFYEFSDRREAKKLVRRIDRLDVQFFPEGGHLVNGLPNTIAVKATNYQGNGVQFEGNITDRSGNVIAPVKSTYAGMARVSFTPEAGKKYYAELQFKNEKDKRYRLPDRKERGTVMHVDNNPGEDEFIIHLHSNIRLKGNPNRKKFFVNAMVRNTIYHLEQYKLKEGNATIRIPREKFPAGIVHFTLFNRKREPLAERLAFHKKEAVVQQPNLQVNPFAGSDSVRVSFQANAATEVEKSSFSLAVIEETQAKQDLFQNINTYFLLSSDLKGKIENPQWYFTGNYQEKAKALDNLLLTQGWRRFSWNEVLDKSWEEPEFAVQNKLEVGGKVTRELIKLPFENARVELVVLNKYNDTYQTRTNEDGRFHFDNLNYQDTVEMLLKARKPNGSRFVLVWLDDTDLREPEYQISEPDSFLADYKLRKRNPANRERRERTPGAIHGTPDQAIDIKPYHNTGYSSVFDILKGRVPGFNNGVIRGFSSIYLSSEPLYIVDGVPVDRAAVASIPVNDIDRVEILKNPSNTTIYGVRGANGVIAVYTMQGHHVSHGKREFSMMGYHTPTEFYRPAFKQAQKQDYPLTLKTLYWAPDLRPDSDGRVETAFPVKHVKGDYMVEIQGVISGKGAVNLQERLKLE